MARARFVGLLWLDKVKVGKQIFHQSQTNKDATIPKKAYRQRILWALLPRTLRVVARNEAIQASSHCEEERRSNLDDN